MHPLRTLLCAGVLSLTAAPVAQAEIYLDFGGDGPSHPGRLLVKEGKVQITSQARGQWEHYMLYFSDSDELHQVTPRKFVDYRFTRERIDEVRAAADLLRERHTEQLRMQLMGNLPPDQRDQLEHQLQAKDGPAYASIQYRPTGQMREIQGVRCEVHAGSLDGEPVAEACVAGPEALGMSDENYRALRGMYAMTYYLAKNFFSDRLPFGPAHAGLFDGQVQGLPIAVRELDGGETALTAVEHLALDDAEFAIPDGYVVKDPFTANP